MTLSGYPAETPNEARDDRLSSTPTRVLLVDDDRVFARSLARALRSLGFTIEVCNDGAQAIEWLDTKYYDALLLDLEMHPVDGWQVLDLHAKLKDPPAVVVLSGHLDVPRTVRALRAGVTDAYQKPADPLELARGLKDAIVKRSGDAPLADADSDDSFDRTNLLVGHAPTLQVVRSQIRRVSRYRDMPVMIVGEPGCEQMLVARTIHALDASGGPLEVLDCDAYSNEQLETEIFGVAAGPFAGALAAKPGVLERAQGGTLFLDNISETSPALQARLLHMLETKRYRSFGGNEEHAFQARVVSATRRSILEGQIQGMRPDLYYRLAGITVVLPPLRARMEDLAPLAEHYAQRLGTSGAASKRFSARALGALHDYDWPGNLVELESVIRGAVRSSKGGRVGTKEIRAALRRHSRLADGKSFRPSIDPGDRVSQRPTSESNLPKVERALIIDAFESAQRNISEAARQLGIPRSTMRDRLRRLGLL